MVSGQGPVSEIAQMYVTLSLCTVKAVFDSRKSAALASSKYLNSQSSIKMELSAQADCATNFLQAIKLQERRVENDL